MPHPSGNAFQFDFDFWASRLRITTTSGDERAVALTARPVADFYEELMTSLDALGVSTEIWPMPVEIPDAVPFPRDREHVTYDAGDAPVTRAGTGWRWLRPSGSSRYSAVDSLASRAPSTSSGELWTWQ